MAATACSWHLRIARWSALWTAAALAGCGDPGPELWIDGEPAPARERRPDAVFDFGEIWNGRILEHEFPVENRGSAPLSILELRPSCECAHAEIDGRLLAAGQRAKVRLTYDSLGLSGDQTGSVALRTDDPLQPEFRYRFRLSVTHFLQTQPQEFDFGPVPKRESAAQPFRIAEAQGRPWRILSARCAEPRFALSAPAPGEPSASHVLEIVFRPGGALGDASGELEIESDLAAQPRVRIKLLGRGAPDTLFEPDRILAFGIVMGDQPVTRSVRVRRTNPERPLRAVEAAIEPSDRTTGVVELSFLTATAREIEPGEEWRVDVTIASGAPRGLLLFPLAISTDDPDVPVHRIRIAGVCEGKP